MRQARIYKPTKSAMQSGRANSRRWILEFEPKDAKRPDSLMGWAGSSDTLSQVRLRFDSLEDATRYAKRHSIAYEVIAEQKRVPLRQVYASNFR